MSRQLTMHDMLPIGNISERSGVPVPTLRFYEEQGILTSYRTSGNQRRYPRHVLRRLAFIKAAQQFGMSLADIRKALDHLPQNDVPTESDWKYLTGIWQKSLQERIDQLTAMRDSLDYCVGCGCLSTSRCPLVNPNDICAAEPLQNRRRRNAHAGQPVRRRSHRH
ncbi:MerR family transcriptional regulator, redox-sensitive transcriptional activator SoxR [Austwickia chelonae]|uniref:Putative MerR family transcriptional regulator n=1 Tax=Austwickia chelonae NBRC 105200 TaxID=1184607 RepID=K6VAH8_9MICO|nr:redox-sensitive transcriptional activator SoxR [Austwickia chelonae]GAB79243.1 putative MerR family transcriptional regulator [Austwickia chelonae NBRC 105200]SEW37545.1 MerR family transcriptional regulator, redox-sensitive transcriptional activator SoxR [Austwickia chelonae]